MHPIEKWHHLIKSNDPDKFDELLDENCTFYSPVVFTPIKGREMTKMFVFALFSYLLVTLLENVMFLSILTTTSSATCIYFCHFNSI